MMINRIVTKTRIHHALCKRHTDSVGNPLAEGSGGGFDSRRVAVFRMAGGFRSHLTEVSKLINRHARITGKVQKRIEQHRSMAVRQYKAIPVRPIGLAGVKF